MDILYVAVHHLILTVIMIITSYTHILLFLLPAVVGVAELCNKIGGELNHTI